MYNCYFVSNRWAKVLVIFDPIVKNRGASKKQLKYTWANVWKRCSYHSTTQIYWVSVLELLFKQPPQISQKKCITSRLALEHFPTLTIGVSRQFTYEKPILNTPKELLIRYFHIFNFSLHKPPVLRLIHLLTVMVNIVASTTRKRLIEVTVNSVMEV